MTHIPHPFGQRTLARALAVTLATALVCTSALAQTGRVASRTGDSVEPLPAPTAGRLGPAVA